MDTAVAQAPLKFLTPEAIKELISVMFQGWIIREASWVPAAEDTQFSSGSYGKTEEEAMIEACQGDKSLGYLLHLFSYWSNDIQVVAPDYGIFLNLEETEQGLRLFVDTVPAKPNHETWWDLEEGRWATLAEVNELSGSSDVEGGDD